MTSQPQSSGFSRDSPLSSYPLFPEKSRTRHNCDKDSGSVTLVGTDRLLSLGTTCRHFTICTFISHHTGSFASFASYGHLRNGTITVSDDSFKGKIPIILQNPKDNILSRPKSTRIRLSYVRQNLLLQFTVSCCDLHLSWIVFAWFQGLCLSRMELLLSEKILKVPSRILQESFLCLPSSLQPSDLSHVLPLFP